jgi:hypothetical protein
MSRSTIGFLLTPVVAEEMELVLNGAGSLFGKKIGWQKDQRQ